MPKTLKEKRRGWVITVGGYGSFYFTGSSSEAEEMRRHKSEWEGGTGRKRLATPREVRRKKPEDWK